MEFTIGNVIKMILAILVIAAIAYALYHFFGDYVLDSFKNIGINTPVGTFLILIWIERVFFWVKKLWK